MPSGGTKTPIDSAAILQATGQVSGYGRVSYSVAGVDTAWMSPGQPLQPLADDPKFQTRGRLFDFPVNVNMVPRTRTNEQVTFEQLRALADNWDLLRTVIENEKDNLAKLKWKFKPKDEKDQPDDRCTALTELFQMPDGEHVWEDWLRMILEDMLVIDAATIFPVSNKGGDAIYGFEPVDGATIKRIIDGTGRTPLPPSPAYQQIMKGIQTVEYTRDQLIYRPRNIRTNRIYGFSPVEQIVMTINIALRRQVNTLSYYTEGNVPDLIFGVPSTWQPDQIKQFQDWWDALNSGQTKHKGRFVPDGVKPYNTKDITLKDDFDEWLARIVCFAFSTAPTPFIKQVNRATAQSAQEDAQAEGLLPRMNWVRNLINYIVWKYFGFKDLEFDWDMEAALDPLEAAQIDDINVRNATSSVDEIRQKRGDKPIGMGPAVFTATGPVPVTDFDKQQAEQAKQSAALAEQMANRPAPEPGPDPSDPNAKPTNEGAPAGANDKPPTDQPADGTSKFAAPYLKKKTLTSAPIRKRVM